MQGRPRIDLRIMPDIDRDLSSANCIPVIDVQAEGVWPRVLTREFEGGSVWIQELSLIFAALRIGRTRDLFPLNGPP
ncbi:MAG TPA: hypothetical protein DEW46_07950, partial [Verrucomicrobia bacterium]|nr:hypothetical protein [Verrucomicrobiota bacterium]